MTTPRPKDLLLLQAGEALGAAEVAEEGEAEEAAGVAAEAEGGDVQGEKQRKSKGKKKGQIMCGWLLCRPRFEGRLCC